MANFLQSQTIREVYYLYALGASQRQIGALLKIAPNTAHRWTMLFRPHLLCGHGELPNCCSRCKVVSRHGRLHDGKLAIWPESFRLNPHWLTPEELHVIDTAISNYNAASPRGLVQHG